MQRNALYRFLELAANDSKLCQELVALARKHGIITETAERQSQVTQKITS